MVKRHGTGHRVYYTVPNQPLCPPPPPASVPVPTAHISVAAAVPHDLRQHLHNARGRAVCRGRPEPHAQVHPPALLPPNPPRPQPPQRRRCLRRAAGLPRPCARRPPPAPPPARAPGVLPHPLEGLPCAPVPEPVGAPGDCEAAHCVPHAARSAPEVRFPFIRPRPGVPALPCRDGPTCKRGGGGHQFAPLPQSGGGDNCVGKYPL